METALILGLTSGGACLTTCGPLVAAFMAAEQITLRQSAALLTTFLSGRLLGYGGWAVVSWLLGQAIFQSRSSITVFAASDLALGGWLIYYGISRPLGPSHELCPASRLNPLGPPAMNHQTFFRTGIWGLLSGSQVCPPFLAAVAGAARTGTLGGSLLFFLIFYLGTGVWFTPFPFVGTLGRFRQVAQVDRFCALLLGVYYIYSGFITVVGGNATHG